MTYRIFLVDIRRMLLVYSMQCRIETHRGDLDMDLGDRIKRQREKRRLTQTELAELAHVNQALISRLESKISASTNSDALKALAKALGCTTDYLVGMYEDEKEDAA